MIGAPSLPIASITDGDIVITSTQDLNPFPGFTSSFNGIHATYPEPAMMWEPKEAPPLYNPTWEAEDQGQRLVANLSMPTVPYGAQVRRVMEAYIREERRFRRHGNTLPPDAAILEPLDTLSWTSTANGYSAKVFEISEITDDLLTGNQTVALRERDPGDYVSSNPSPPPVVSPIVVAPPAQVVPGFAVTGVSITDAVAANRRPALRLAWEPDLDDVRAILWQVRVQATGLLIASGSTDDVALGQLIVSEAILPSTLYEARVKPVIDRPADWTVWVSAGTPATPPVQRPDIGNGAVSDKLTQSAPTLTIWRTGESGFNVPQVVLTTGPIALGDVWFVGAGGLLRAAATYSTRCLVQRRYRTGGVWGPLETVYTFNVNSGTTANQGFGWGDVLAGLFQDVEYSLLGQIGGGSSIPASNNSLASNFTITAQKILK